VFAHAIGVFGSSACQTPWPYHVLALQLAKREGGVEIDVVATRVGVVGVVANNLVVAHEKLDTKGDVCC
jgi:hypothetical protein